MLHKASFESLDGHQVKANLAWLILVFASIDLHAVEIDFDLDCSHYFVEFLVVLNEHFESPAVQQLVCYCVRASRPWLGRASPLACWGGAWGRGGGTLGTLGAMALEAESSILLLPAFAELTIVQWDSDVGRGYNQNACLVVFALRGQVPIVVLQEW